MNAHFINNEKQIITGSEDNSVYIYDSSDGRVRKIIKTKSKINHIVNPISSEQGSEILISGLQENIIHFYGCKFEKNNPD